jgi:hypothetical protein
VIGLGFTMRWRPAKRRTLAYTRMRRTKRRARSPQPRPLRHDQTVIFDHGPSELPTATLIARKPSARTIAGALHAWLHARWQWFSPRAVPVIVATIGMILVLLSVDYLAHSHYEPLPDWRP